MSVADLSDLDIDDEDITAAPRTPTPTEVPAIVRELARVQRAHGRAIRAMRRLVQGVVFAVLTGSVGVMGTVAGAAWYLGARMGQIETNAARIERLEHARDQVEANAARIERLERSGVQR